MGILAIRRLVDKFTISDIRKMEFAIIQEDDCPEVEGKDQADKLSNLIAAVWILEEMKGKGMDFREALCEYSKKVRSTIEVN